ncbi:caspase family protein [Pararhodobacter sp. SW119]|uniref:caspase family protein n=1 Tax=Pararhodobacter sp. SW119 TaxID=2780075 RepID=UPI001AE0C775|nr:caspase family protein [Pararhodobacter sp. SW119]
MSELATYPEKQGSRGEAAGPLRHVVSTVAVVLALAAGPAAAQSLSGGGIALVVGNERYEAVEALANPVADARAVAQMLRDFGFRVHDGYDLDREEFEDLLRTALLNVDEGDEVLFFFAGHGVQIGQRNYLLPVDARFDDVYDLPKYSITLDRVIEALSARSSAHAAIIDACRENPLPDHMLAAGLDASFYEARDGFQVMRTPINSLVAFSASPGALALDGEAGGHSPYTHALIGAVRESPRDNLTSVLSQVRERVYSVTDGFQVPWESSTLVRPFVLQRMPAEDDAPAAEIPMAAVRPEPPQDTLAEAPTVDETPADEVASTPQVAPEPETQLAALPDSLTVDLRFDRRVPLGDAVAAVLGRSIDGAEIVTAPTRGRIELAELADAGRATRNLVPVGLSDAVHLRGGALTFRPALREIHAVGDADFSVSDSFRMRLDTGDSAQTVTVNLELEVDPCDLEAGDALDLQGVGYYRWPNEIDPAVALEACGAAVAAAPETARFLFQYGRAQLADRDFEGAYRSFSTAAEAGHIRAYTELAILLTAPQVDRTVFNIPADPERARALLERGIAAGDPFAMHELGKQLFREASTEAERERGFELLDRAAEMGHTFSMNELGYNFMVRDSGIYQPARGMAYLTVSSERNDIYGHHNLGLVALLGLDGNDPDFTRARDYLVRAAEGGHPRAPADLGRMYVRGQLGEQDLAEALRWYDVGMERGDGTSGTNAAEIILTGRLADRSPADAALRAAKVVEMPNSDAVDRAREQLGRIDTRAKDRATQMLLVVLGESIAVDGAVGPATRNALTRQAEAYGLAASGLDDPTARLLLAARAYWAANPPRLDLY